MLEPAFDPFACLPRLESPPPSFGGKYEIKRVLGRGGMGTVYEARHARLGHSVALKVLAEELRAYPDLVARFEREARASRALSSPHAVRIFDIETTNEGTPFIVMELLRGCDLAQRLERGRPPIGLAVRWMIDAMDAIGEAHRLGIVHRDIKPSNLLLCDDGSIKVLDFGIAKQLPPKAGAAKDVVITQSAAPLGTPQYMSPEQVRCSRDIDGRADIWSLGVTLFEILCGRPPYKHDAPPAIIAAVVADPVPDPRRFRSDLPDMLAEAMLRALRKDPAERFQTVEAFVLALTPFADEVRAKTPSSPTLALVTPRSGRGPGVPSSHDEVVLPLYPRLPSAGGRSVPPAVKRATTSRGRRVRSAVAMATAAALGLFTLVSTPRCVGSSGAVTARLPPVPARPDDLVLEPEPPPPVTAFTPPPPRTGTPPPEAPRESMKAEAAGRAPRWTRPRATRPAPATDARASVLGPAHGGLSSPGF